MLTMDLELKQKAQVAARVVMLFHRLAMEIDELHMSGSATPGILQMRICVQADPGQHERVRANLHKLLDVISVEIVSPEQAQVGTARTTAV